MILLLMENWDAKGNQVPIEILLPEALRADFEGWFEKKISETLQNKPRFDFALNIEGGFQIIPENSSYKIDFSEEGFIELFRQYLKPRTRKILFEES